MKLSLSIYFLLITLLSAATTHAWQDDDCRSAQSHLPDDDQPLNDSNHYSKLILAAERGDSEKIKSISHAYPGQENLQQNGDSITPLIAGAKCNQLSAIKTLLELGADPNFLGSVEENMSVTFERTSALIWAASRDNYEVSKYLLGHGADPTIRDVKKIYSPEGESLEPGFTALTSTTSAKIKSLLKNHAVKRTRKADSRQQKYSKSMGSGRVGQRSFPSSLSQNRT